ncbi:hypothetical protein ACLKA6_011310 [Drosophila palustris]
MKILYIVIIFVIGFLALDYGTGSPVPKPDEPIEYLPISQPLINIEECSDCTNTFHVFGTTVRRVRLKCLQHTAAITCDELCTTFVDGSNIMPHVKGRTLSHRESFNTSRCLMTLAAPVPLCPPLPLRYPNHVGTLCGPTQI